MIASLVFAAAYAVCGLAQDWLVGSGLAVHLDGQAHCRKWITPGIGMEHAATETSSYAVGVYENSNCHTSWYAARIWTPLKLLGIRAGVLGGVVSGYEKPVLPVAGFAATLELGDYGVNAIFIPPYRDSGNVLWLQVKRAWN